MMAQGRTLPNGARLTPSRSGPARCFGSPQLRLWLGLGFFAAILSCGWPSPTAAQEILTNDSVVSMVKGGLPEGVIVAKIRSSQAKFDVRTEALIALKQAGVPDKVLEAMVAQSAQAASPAPPLVPPAPPAPASPPATALQPTVILPLQLPAGVAASPSTLAALQGLQRLQGRGTINHVVGDKQVELTAVSAEIQTSTVPFFGYQKSELVLPGSKAGYRTAERQPVFLSPSPPSEMPLVRLKPGSDDRNLKVSSGTTLPFVGRTQRQGVRGEDKIDVEAQRDPNGLYRIRPRKPLEPGEYGFIHTLGFAGATGGRVYDFGVD